MGRGTRLRLAPRPTTGVYDSQTLPAATPAPTRRLAGPQRRRILTGGLLLLAGGALQAQSGTPAGSVQPAGFSFAVVPQFPPQQLLAEWQPLLDRLASATGIRLTLRFFPTIPAFEAAFMRGEADFAFMNPYHAVMARRTQDYQPLVRDGALLHGILVVAANSPIRVVQDLDGQRIAYPSPNAFGASLYMRALLAEQFKVRTEPVYVGNHVNVYRRVAVGDIAAGGGVNQTFDEQPAELRARLRVIFTTPGTATHLLAAHPRVPAAVRGKVQSALLELAGTTAGRKLLTEVRLPQPVVAQYARDYAPLEKLGLEKYLVFGN